jgi:anaerobic dimethyl sulfoxide reductase subunit B (iron-sulfur subunit)
MAKQLGFFIDQNYCTGCKTCQIVCKDKNDLPEGVIWRRVAEWAGGSTNRFNGAAETTAFAYYTSISCNHCADPICVKVCPTTAIHKGEDGIVSIDDGLCVGCRLCEWACPYGAPQFDSARGVETKCNFCADFLAEGKEPACVAACPSRALEFGELSELQAKHGSINNIAPLPDPSITRPSLVIAPSRNAQLTGSTVGSVVNPKELV